MRSGLLALGLVSLAAACGGVEETATRATPTRATSAETRSATEPLPLAARVACRGNDLAVVEPRVQVQDDGIHFRIEAGAQERSFSVHTVPGAGIGRTAPAGTSQLVVQLPPGRLLVRCHSDVRDPSELPPAELTAVDPDGIWQSTERSRTCRTGVHIQGSVGAEPGREPTGARVDPVALVRRLAGDRLEPGDVVERGGYPLQSEPEVRIVRSGEVVAVYRLVGGERRGWTVDSISACAGIGWG